QGRPCKIVDMSKSRAGYGFKVHIVGIDIFRGKRLEAIEKSTCEMEVPVVEHKEYELITVENGFLKLMTKDGTIKDDVMLPDFGELGKEIQQASDEGKTMLITVQSTADEEA
ncbi:eukaryotic translation initiation factor 5A, partial [Mycena leptocephala]